MLLDSIFNANHIVAAATTSIAFFGATVARRGLTLNQYLRYLEVDKDLSLDTHTGAMGILRDNEDWLITTALKLDVCTFTDSELSQLRQQSPLEPGSTTWNQINQAMNNLSRAVNQFDVKVLHRQAFLKDYGEIFLEWAVYALALKEIRVKLFGHSDPRWDERLTKLMVAAMRFNEAQTRKKGGLKRVFSRIPPKMIMTTDLRGVPTLASALQASKSVQLPGQTSIIACTVPHQYVRPEPSAPHRSQSLPK